MLKLSTEAGVSRSVDLPSLETVRAPSAADQIFAALYRQVLTLELPPGSRLSEAEVARRMGVSRQPVRDAFWRLSQLGFLTIRPQRATTVSPNPATLKVGDQIVVTVTSNANLNINFFGLGLPTSVTRTYDARMEVDVQAPVADDSCKS